MTSCVRAKTFIKRQKIESNVMQIGDVLFKIREKKGKDVWA